MQGIKICHSKNTNLIKRKTSAWNEPDMSLLNILPAPLMSLHHCLQENGNEETSICPLQYVIRSTDQRARRQTSHMIWQNLLWESKRFWIKLNTNLTKMRPRSAFVRISSKTHTNLIKYNILFCFRCQWYFFLPSFSLITFTFLRKSANNSP